MIIYCLDDEFAYQHLFLIFFCELKSSSSQFIIIVVFLCEFLQNNFERTAWDDIE